MLIACQGPAGSYGYVAARVLYPAAKRVVLPDLFAVVRAVARSAADLGIVPVENSIIGPVVEGERALADNRVVAVNAIELPVRHCLLALSGSDPQRLRSVESHPAALAQCAGYVASLGLASWPATSTAAAAQAVANDRNFSRAAIAGEEAAELYGLVVLDREIADVPDNRTRFIVVAKAPCS